MSETMRCNVCGTIIRKGGQLDPDGELMCDECYQQMVNIWEEDDRRELEEYERRLSGDNAKTQAQVFHDNELERLRSFLHARALHPDYEYKTTTGPRKAWIGGMDEPPEGEGWEVNEDAGCDGWERFEYREQVYWRRRKTKA